MAAAGRARNRAFRRRSRPVADRLVGRARRPGRRSPRPAARSATLGLVVLALGALGLAACGSTESPLRAVVNASTKSLTQTAGSSTVLSGAAAFGGGAPVRVQEAFAFPRGLGYGAIPVPARGTHPSHTVYLDFFPTSVDLESLAGITLPSGKTWISGSLVVAPPRRFPRFAEQLEGMNPALLLDELAWGATTATSRGQDVIDHVPYAEYAVVLDLRRALAGSRRARNRAMSAAIADEIGATASTGATQGRVTARMTVWVDGPGRVVQIRAALPGSGLGTLTTTLTNFGVSIPTSPPPASETVPIATVAQSATSPWVFGG